MEVESVIRKYIPSRTAKRYQIMNQGRGIVIRKLKEEETKVIPEVFSKPVVPSNVIKPTYIKPIEARKMLDEMAKSKTVKIDKESAKEVKKPISVNAPSIPSFNNFNDIAKFVQEQKKENSERNKQILQKLKEEKKETKEVTVTEDEQEDIEDLVNGNIQKEQELINDEYLKSLEKRTVKRLFKMVTGYAPSKQTTRYEMRKTILEKYKEMPSSKKQLVYEASKLKD